LHKKFDPDTSTRYGVLRVDQFKGVSYTSLRPTPIAMATTTSPY